MKKYECVIAPVSDPTDEQIVIIESTDPGSMLIANHNERPGTYIKSWRELTE